MRPVKPKKPPKLFKCALYGAAITRDPYHGVRNADGTRHHCPELARIIENKLKGKELTL